ncbi:hypothetical protein ACFX14_038608 [Malus domestica]
MAALCSLLWRKVELHMLQGTRDCTWKDRLVATAVLHRHLTACCPLPPEIGGVERVATSAGSKGRIAAVFGGRAGKNEMTVKQPENARPELQPHRRSNLFLFKALFITSNFQAQQQHLHTTK